MMRNLPLSFGITPSGTRRKFSTGGVMNGPAIRPAWVSSAKNLSTSCGCCLVVGRLRQLGKPDLGPSYWMRAPFLMTSKAKSTSSCFGWFLNINCHAVNTRGEDGVCDRVVFGMVWVDGW